MRFLYAHSLLVGEAVFTHRVKGSPLCEFTGCWVKTYCGKQLEREASLWKSQDIFGDLKDFQLDMCGKQSAKRRENHPETFERAVCLLSEPRPEVPALYHFVYCVFTNAHLCLKAQAKCHIPVHVSSQSESRKMGNRKCWKSCEKLCLWTSSSSCMDLVQTHKCSIGPWLVRCVLI